MSIELDSATRGRAIQQIAKLLQTNYAFPETGEVMANRILAKLDTGEYDHVTNPAELSGELTFDLRNISKDLHLAVIFNPDQAAKLEEVEKNQQEDEQNTFWWQQRIVDNYGLQKIEILTGNVGYLKILVFAPVSLAGQRVETAMSFLSDCHALIFDLRECGGGDPFTVQLIESYLFNTEPKLLHTLYDRPKDKHQQIWTLPQIRGKHMPDVPVYILTSGRTFSGGEDFSYVLKHHGRAMIIGEVTGGGGHTVEFISAGNGFIMALPIGYPTHPVTGGNWEGVGVKPDIAVPREQALKTAHLHAIETLLKQNEGESIWLQEQHKRLQAIYIPLELKAAQLEKFTGIYGSYQAIVKDGQLTLGEVN